VVRVIFNCVEYQKMKEYSALIARRCFWQ